MSVVSFVGLRFIAFSIFAQDNPKEYITELGVEKVTVSHIAEINDICAASCHY
ncbi:hypothetical protein OAN12_03805 [Halioglobus sp.]|nr:hypothetical protein [Halioglobus sp.]